MGEKTNENTCSSKSYKTQIEDCFRGTTPAIADLLRPYGKAEMLFCADVIIRDLDLCIDVFGAGII